MGWVEIFQWVGSTLARFYFLQPTDNSYMLFFAKKARIDDSFVDQATGPITVSGREELARYKAMRMPAAILDPLYSSSRTVAIEYRYPELAEASGSSAGLALSERDFSSVGHTTDVRSRLMSAVKVDSIELVRWGLRAKCCV